MKVERDRERDKQKRGTDRRRQRERKERDPKTKLKTGKQRKYSKTYLHEGKNQNEVALVKTDKDVGK